MKKILFLVCTLCILSHTYAKIPAQHKIRLTDNWEFLRSDLGSIWEAVRPGRPGDSEGVPLWTKVTLPHCFNAEDAVDPDVNYYQGPGWYKTLLDIRNPYPNGRVILDFEGAGQKTEVYIYTRKVGEHIGGYDEWSIDITDAINELQNNEDWKKRFNGKIPLSIRCDNTRDTEMIPSDLSDFNLYGGLYRYLNLVYVPELSFENIIINSALDKGLKGGTFTIEANFHNPDDIKEAGIQMVLKDATDKEILRRSANVLPLGNQQLFEVQIKNPQIWDVSNPQLYTCEITLSANNQELTVTEKFGFRHFEFIEQGPFMLNGRRLLLQGTHRHEDHAGVAAAMTEEQMTQEMQLMKEMGVNFIRLGHYQQSSIILDLCDQLGILVWEEIPWCRGGLGGEIYKVQARRMLTNMITQHRNHPSVIIWGMGNENDWPNDFPEFDKAKIRAFMKELHDLSHQLDPTRKTAIRRCDFCKDIVDVYSPSIWAGWYRGMFTDYKNVSHNEMKRVKHFLHVEWGGDSHARRHAEDPFINLDKIVTGKGADERAGDASLYGGTARASKDGDWSESYIVRLIDWHLKEQETMDWLTGTAYWPFKDFSTPVRPENPVPYMNQKGVVERDLTRKESYYVFQSYWTEKPMIHIYGHSWPMRWGEKGEKKEILVYSNCREAELFVNGISQGIKKRNSSDFPAAGLRWECELKEGENIIKSIGRKSKVQVEDEITVIYQTDKWSEPHSFLVKTYPSDDNMTWVEAQLVDKNGVPCLDARNVIHFEIAGDGKLIQNQGTSTGSRKVQAYNGRAKIKADITSECYVAVKSSGIKTAYTNLTGN